jgi:hypothetical protein
LRSLTTGASPAASEAPPAGGVVPFVQLAPIAHSATTAEKERTRFAVMATIIEAPST